MNFPSLPSYCNFFISGISSDSLASGWNSISKLTIKVYNFINDYFKTLESLSLIGIGGKELLIGYFPLSRKIKKINLSEAFVVRTAAQSHFRNIQITTMHHFLGRGIFFGLAGTLSLCFSLDQLQVSNLGTTRHFFRISGTGLFLFGCLYSLEKHARIFQEARKMKESAWNVEEKNLAQRIEFSAILGIIADLSYIITTICTFFQEKMAIYIIIGLFSIFSMSIKNIYDFFFLQIPEIT